jgi:Ca-activated chloride channel family protein
MVTLQPWVGLVSAAAAMAIAVAVVWTTLQRRRRAAVDGEAAIANVHHAEASPLFRRMRRRYHVLLGGEVAALSIVGLSAVGLTMRPVTDRELERDVRNRDVMLCLDVSTSMNELDAIVLREFAELAAGLRGERIGLTIFNGSAITVFPLTDDAEFIASTLDDAATALAQRKRTFVEGTEEGGTSLIGDGLASCAMRFDSDERGRSRSIVFATDNALAGEPILQLPEAAALVRERGIRVYAIAAADRITTEDAAELRAAAESTGGEFFETDKRSTTADVIVEIGRQEASRLDVPPETVADDRPTTWIVACFAGLGALFAVGWALKR